MAEKTITKRKSSQMSFLVFIPGTVARSIEYFDGSNEISRDVLKGNATWREAVKKISEGYAVAIVAKLGSKLLFDVNAVMVIYPVLKNEIANCCEIVMKIKDFALEVYRKVTTVWKDQIQAPLLIFFKTNQKAISRITGTDFITKIEVELAEGKMMKEEGAALVKSTLKKYWMELFQGVFDFLCGTISLIGMELCKYALQSFALLEKSCSSVGYPLLLQ